MLNLFQHLVYFVILEMVYEKIISPIFIIFYALRFFSAFARHTFHPHPQDLKNIKQIDLNAVFVVI